MNTINENSQTSMYEPVVSRKRIEDVPFVGVAFGFAGSFLLFGYAAIVVESNVLCWMAIAGFILTSIAMSVLTNKADLPDPLGKMASNVQKKHQAKLVVEDISFTDDFYYTLDQPKLYSLITADGTTSTHQMYFMTSGEPMIVENDPPLLNQRTGH